MTQSFCCEQDDRRDAVRRMNGRNGLDYVEVGDDQITLTAYFLGKLPAEFAPQAPDKTAHLAIEGGRRTRDIKVASAVPVIADDPEKDDALVITTDKAGDFSVYSLRLVNVGNIDPRYQTAEFSFKVNCPSDLDCAPQCACEPESPPEPEIDYLAKDYGSFRQLILDRLAVIMPDWKERHAADIGIALVEALAYTGDYLSYYQDAVATEAYLDTARQRISVRRLVRLVDYFLHEGCNARAWVAIETGADFTLPAGAAFITGLNDALADPRTMLGWDDLQLVPTDSYEVFEPFERAEVPIREAHSRIFFYTWGEKECCIRRGSTSATLLDAWTGQTTRRLDHLAEGDVLIFEEVIGPHTGLAGDADPARRQAVRIVTVTRGEDPVYADATGRPTPFVDIEWDTADALRFTFCISAMGPAPECRYFENISVARGNVILVDHGKTQPGEDFGPVPTLTTEAVCECAGKPGDVTLFPGRIQPSLKKAPLTYREPLPAKPSAAESLKQDIRKALPQLSLTSTPSRPWEVRYDLIASDPGDWHFVVEIDNDGLAHLRFGDGILGAQPPSGMTLTAVYRVGNGPAGNVGAEAISRLITPTRLSGAGILVRNPLPAQGGAAAEPIAEAKLFAPHDFRKRLERAITWDDYETIAERDPRIQRASADLVWTGSWYEADVAVDPLGSETASHGFLEKIEHYLERYRRIGHDLEVEQAQYVPIELELDVCALPEFERAHVKAALLDRFSTRLLRGGLKGFFHPDNLTFGEDVFLSRIIAAAQAVPGVECVTVRTLQRLFEPPNGEIENGVLPLANGEIAQLDNDPDFPERGKLILHVLGGR
ncbi:MAG: putative baseplate assembly protein [Betaproteobacteria bacterium]|nr:putative baseplate assembly protein [Betaproteobacteria bacterium]